MDGRERQRILSDKWLGVKAPLNVIAKVVVFHNDTNVTESEIQGIKFQSMYLKIVITS